LSVIEKRQSIHAEGEMALLKGGSLTNTFAQTHKTKKVFKRIWKTEEALHQQHNHSRVVANLRELGFCSQVFSFFAVHGQKLRKQQFRELTIEPPCTERLVFCLYVRE
jgi:hypothetical protein